MAYSELIKNYEKIRDYMRQFYVYGFKTREEYDKKSARSYDNERRRIESWLGDFMEFRRESSGKTVFLSVDSRSIRRNPFFKAFKAKSFTDKDITLNFYILDILQPGVELSAHEIIEKIHKDYLPCFETQTDIDDSTVRKKLKEYEQLGILKSRKTGREVFFSRSQDNVDIDSWWEAAAFFSEADPMGVVGSYILDKCPEEINHFNFKHHYILHSLDSQILLQLLQGIKEHRAAEVRMISVRQDTEVCHTVCPLKILISTQNGRQYLMCYHYKFGRMMTLRLDYIHSVKPGSAEKEYDKYLGFWEKYRENLWGVSAGPDCSTEHIEMTLHIEAHEDYVLERLWRERRCGRVEKTDESTYKFSADVYDAAEMLTWIRTFTGRIVSFECSSKYVEERFYDDLEKMRAMYGGDDDAVQ